MSEEVNGVPCDKMFGAIAKVREDADMALFERTAHQTYCPYKGDASYYTIKVGGRVAENAIWSYETPFPAMKDITGYLAFYPSRVDKIETTPG